MNPTDNPFDDPAFAQSFAAAFAGCVVLVLIIIHVVITHFTARAVAVVPVEQRRIQPGVIWGLTVAACVLSAIVTIGPAFTIDAASTSGDVFTWGFIVLQVVLLAVNMVWVWWVGRGVPGSFSTAFQAYEGDAGVPAGDHGRSLGRWMIAIYTIMGVVSLITISLAGPTNLAEEMRAASPGTQGGTTSQAKQPPVRVAINGQDIATDSDSTDIVISASGAETDGPADATGAPSENSTDRDGTTSQEKQPRVRVVVNGETVAMDSDSTEAATSSSDGEPAASADATGVPSGNPADPGGMTPEEKQLREAMKQVPLLVTACVEALLGLVFLVLLITFLVKITNLRGSLLDLQFAASDAHDGDRDPRVPPLA